MKKLNLKVIISVLGLTSMLNGFFMFLAIPFSIYYKESYWEILTSGIITLLMGFLLWVFNRNTKKDIGKKEGYIIVTLGWLMLSFTGTLPYVISGTIPHFTDAFFETMSGYSTTGASILTDIEAMPKGILFWRSATHWIGGMGIIVLAVAILPLLGIGGMQLFMAEASGPSTNKIHPRITETAKRLWIIYFSLTIVEFFLLKIAGMNWYDAINHAMSTMSTGGFSTKNASIAYWNAYPVIQYIIILFMFIAGTNFILTYFALKGKFKKAYTNEEFLYYFFGVIGISFIVGLTIIYNQDPALVTTIHHPKPFGEIESAFRHAAFQVTSVLTTTGFVTADYTKWNSFATMVIFSLFLIGGSAGSTSGGIKIVRHIVMIKNSIFEFKKLLHPNAILPVRYDGGIVPKNIVYNILAFFILYMLIFIMSTMALTFFGLDFESSMGAAATSMAGIGPAFGTLGPVDNFAHISDAAKWICSFLMLTGRLEIFTILILFTPFFWKKN